MFDFQLVHVPGKKFQGPDGLSRRRRTVEDEEGEEEREAAEEWVEEILMCGIWMASGFVGLNKVWEIKEVGNGKRALVLVMGIRMDGEMQGMLNYALMSVENETGAATTGKTTRREPWGLQQDEEMRHYEKMVLINMAGTVTMDKESRMCGMVTAEKEIRGVDGLEMVDEGTEARTTTDVSTPVGRDTVLVSMVEELRRYEMADEVFMAGPKETKGDLGMGELGKESAWVAAVRKKLVVATEDGDIPRTKDSSERDVELMQVKNYLELLKLPDGMAKSEVRKFLKKASRFFVAGGRLWYCEQDHRHWVVIFDKDRKGILIDAHDNLGHKGYYATRRHVADRFYWPTLDEDLRWYLTTCHECQIMSKQKVFLPPTVSMPRSPFQKCYIDTMHLPRSGGFKYVVQARDSLLGWPEFAKLRKENRRTLGTFILEQLMMRWGILMEIVTDNGTPFVAALEWLSEKYNVSHIRISGYNSRANGIVEVTHQTVRTALIKSGDGDLRGWHERLPYVMWADRITIRRSTGMSPFYAVHGFEPLLPFDITHATFLLPTISGKMTDAELLAIRSRQLERRDEDIAEIQKRVLKARFGSIADFEKKHKHTIIDYDFAPGELVLVLNKKIEPDLGRKGKARYFGPLMVVKRLLNGNYRLSELTGAISKLKYAAFRLVPYYPRCRKTFKVTNIVEEKEFVGMDED